MENKVRFQVFREDGVYTADGLNVPIVTEGRTLKELQANIKEAVELYFEDEDFAELGFCSSPSIVTSFTLTPNFHGGGSA